MSTTATSTATTDDHDRLRTTPLIPVLLPLGSRPTTSTASTTTRPAIPSSSSCSGHTRGDELRSESEPDIRNLHDHVVGEDRDIVDSKNAHTTAASAIEHCTTKPERYSNGEVNSVQRSHPGHQESISTSSRPEDLGKKTTSRSNRPTAGKSKNSSSSINLKPSLPKSQDVSSTRSTPSKPSSNSSSAMIFTDLHRTKAAAHRRRIMGSSNAITEYEADLSSRDRMKQRDAVRRLLHDRVRTDWDWQWPQEERPLEIVEQDAGNDDDNNESGWAERDEWESGIDDDASEGEAEAEVEAEVGDMAERNSDLTLVPSCDDVEKDLQQRSHERWTRKRKRHDEEMESNDGLRCFTQRRDAWTGARLVRKGAARSSTVSSPHSPRSTTTTMTALTTPSSRPTSPSSPRFSEQMSLSSPISATKPLYSPTFPTPPDRLHLQIPRPPPLLPPDTPLRKGISERTYPIIYDKVVVQCATPACPINLKDVVRSCVQGWKRDGEWPPKLNGQGGGAEHGQQGQGHGESGIVLARRKMHELGILGSGNGQVGGADGNANGMQGENGKGRGKLKRGLHKVLTVVGGKGERKSL